MLNCPLSFIRHLPCVLTGATLLALLPDPAGLAAQTRPAPAAVPDGTYITERSWGTLTIRKEGARTLFNLSAVGDNAHTCELEGEIRGLQADLTEAGEKDGCKVSFKPAGDRIGVKGSPNGQCQNFCGMRATFEGDYFKAPERCLVDNVDKTRAQFRKLYDRKQFAEGRTLLDDTLKQCGRFIGTVTNAWLRNDLAVTLHKLGERKACLDVLAPLAADAAKKDAEIKEMLPPTDAESYLPVMRATRTNLKLCRPAG